MRTSTQIALEWLPKLLGDDPSVRTVEFMQEVATELLQQSQGREEANYRLERIQQEVKAWSDPYR